MNRLLAWCHWVELDKGASKDQRLMASDIRHMMARVEKLTRALEWIVLFAGSAGSAGMRTPYSVAKDALKDCEVTNE